MTKIAVRSSLEQFDRLKQLLADKALVRLGHDTDGSDADLIISVTGDSTPNDTPKDLQGMTLCLPEDSGFWPEDLSRRVTALLPDSNDRLQQDLDIVDQIQAVRTRNNVNWMELLRVGLTHAPDETKAIFRRVSADDQEINRLLTELVAENRD